MTVTVPEAVDLADLAALDFDTPILCDVNECHHDKVNVQPAVARVVRTQKCCTETAPSCEFHTADALLTRMLHLTVSCPTHKVADCAHIAVRVEPLR